MSKRPVNITSLAQLETEERLVRKRIKRNEKELLNRAKQLPEEVLTSMALKLVSGIIKGGAVKSVVAIAKKVGKNVLSSLFKDVE